MLMARPKIKTRPGTGRKRQSALQRLQQRVNQTSFMPSFNVTLAILFVLGAVLTGFIIFTSHASSLNGVVGGSTSCGARVANYSYVRPYGNNAPWNVPACVLPRMADSNNWRDRFNAFSATEFSSNFGICPKISDQWTQCLPEADIAMPIYNADTDPNAKPYRVRVSGVLHNLKTTNYLQSTETIPFNPAWRPETNQDHFMIITSPKNNTEWELWGVNPNDPVNALGCPIVSPAWAGSEYIGFPQGNEICVMSAGKIAIPQANPKAEAIPANPATYEGNSAGSRGVGIQLRAMLTTPEEVMAGEIRHALPLAVINTMFGPACMTKAVTDPSFGKSCGEALAPAGQFEKRDISGGNNGIGLNCGYTPSISSVVSDANRSKTIPEGMRFALEISDADIEAWLTSRATTDPTYAVGTARRQTAKIFAVAMRDYGWMITDSSCTSGLQMASGANPATGALWQSLGVNADRSSGGDLLFGLLPRYKDKVYALAPATNVCADGSKTQFSCKATRSYYPSIGDTVAAQGVTQPITSSVPPATITPVPLTPTITPTPKPVTPPPSTPTNKVTPAPTTNSNPAAKNQQLASIIPSFPSQPGPVSGSLTLDLTKFGSGISGYGIKLKWPASQATAGIKQYVITRNPNETLFSPTNSYTDFNITNLGVYIYSIQAEDNNGNKSLPSLYAASPVCFWIFCQLK